MQTFSSAPYWPSGSGNFFAGTARQCDFSRQYPPSRRHASICRQFFPGAIFLYLKDYPSLKRWVKSCKSFIRKDIRHWRMWHGSVSPAAILKIGLCWLLPWLCSALSGQKTQIFLEQASPSGQRIEWSCFYRKRKICNELNWTLHTRRVLVFAARVGYLKPQPPTDH